MIRPSPYTKCNVMRHLASKQIVECQMLLRLVCGRPNTSILSEHINKFGNSVVSDMPARGGVSPPEFLCNLANGVFPEKSVSAFLRNKQAVRLREHGTHTTLGHLMGSDKARASDHNPSEVKDLAHGGDRARVNSLKRARGDTMYLGDGNGTCYPRERRVVIELRAAMRTIELRPTDIRVEGEWETIYEKTLDYARQYSNPNISVTGKPDKKVLLCVAGGILQVRERGEGLFDCGAVTRDGVVMVEALRWITSILNQERVTSFLPNITIGLRIFDTCGRFRSAVNQLENFLPSLREEAVLPHVALSQQFGLIDGVGLMREEEVQITLANHNMPISIMDSEVLLISAEDRAKALATLVEKLEWSRVHIVHGDDYYISESKQYLEDEDKWLHEFLKNKKPCKKYNTLNSSNTKDFTCNDDERSLKLQDDLETAIRTEGVISASEAILSLAESLKQAWDSMCTNNTDDFCPELLNMTHREFVHSYFKSSTDSSNMSDSNDSPIFKLIKYIMSPVNISNYISKIMMFSQHNKHELLEKNFTANPVPICGIDTDQCSQCNINKQSRTDSSRHFSHADTYQVLQPSTKISHQHQQSLYHVLLHSPQNLYVAVLLPVHKTLDKENIIQCGGDKELNLNSVRQLEAFLWALERANTRLPGVQLGALLVDTCNSHVHTMSLVSGLHQHAQGLNGYQVLAAVNGLSLADALMANDILSAMNITSIATSQAAAIAELSSDTCLWKCHASPNVPYQQVEMPLSALVDSVVSVLRHLGWTYVSAVHSSASQHFSAGYHLFKEGAARAGICLALQETIVTKNKSMATDGNDDSASQLVTRLMGARAEGARAVVLWTNEDDTHTLMTAIGAALAQGSLRREDLFWLLVSPDGDAVSVFSQYGKVLGGALTFNPQQKFIPEFLHHLKKLQQHRTSHETNRNPWLFKYYQQLEQCTSSECKIKEETSNHNDFNMVQAVNSIVAAVDSTADELCPKAKTQQEGLCLDQHSRSEIQKALNWNIRQSVAEKADGIVGESFRFTHTGMGNIPVEIYNFRRKLHDMSHSLGEIYFEKVSFNKEYNSKSIDTIVSYRDIGDEILVATLTSQCGSCKSLPQCKDHVSGLRDSVMVAAPNKGKQDVLLYIVAALGVHEGSRNPLECGAEVNKEGLEQMEAFLWAIDQMNHNNSNINLTAVVLDTCGSSVKAARDVSRFLEHQYSGQNSQSGGHTIAFIAGGTTHHVESIMESVGYLNVPLLAPQARGPPAHRKKFAPYPLQLSPSNRAQAQAIISILENLRWMCYSVIYQQDGIEYENIFQILEKMSPQFNLTISSGIGIPVGSANVTVHVRRALANLHKSSSKVVTLLLPPERTDLLFRTTHALEDEGLLTPHDLTWVVLSRSEKILEAYSESTLGALILRPKAGGVTGFENYFRNLKTELNMRNPWFGEFWSSVFHCRGAACKNKLYQDLHSYSFEHNPVVVNTINSVLAISHALETVKREICTESELKFGLCSNMKDISRIRRRLSEVTPNMAFVGEGLNAVAFSNSGENSHSDVEVLNLQKVSNGGIKWVSVGNITVSGSVQLNLSLMRAYLTEHRNETSLQHVTYECEVDNATTDNSTFEIYTMEIPSSSKLTLLGLLPVHEPGASPFECGPLNPAALYSLAALSYALHHVNTNITLLPGIHLGLTVLDTCSQSIWAYNAVYNFMASTHQRHNLHDEKGRMPETRLEDIISAVIVESQSTEIVIPLLEAQNISQVVLGLNTSIEVPETSVLGPTSRANLVKAIMSVAHIMRSHSLVVVHGTMTWEELVVLDLLTETNRRKDTVCLAGVYSLHDSEVVGMTGAISSSKMTDTKEIVTRLTPGTLVVILLENIGEIQAFLEVARKMKGLLFLMVLPKLDIHFYAGQTVFTLSPVQNFDEKIPETLTELEGWLFSRDRNDSSFPLPMSWLRELKAISDKEIFFKNNENMFKNLLTVIPNNFEQFIHNTKMITRKVAEKIQTYLENQCAQNTSVSLLECYNSLNHSNVTRELKNILKEENSSLMPSNEKTINNFKLWIGSEHIGTWDKETGLLIYNPAHISNYQTVCTNFDCTICNQQNELYQQSEDSVVLQSLQSSWAVTLGGLTLLGAFLTVLTALYFLVVAAIPNSNALGGTSVLGYIILLGLLLLFTANLSFVLAPAESTCGARRFLPGLAYSVIFAGMLLKVFTTWRLNARGDLNKDTISRPASLVTLVVALALIQALISGGWLVLIPPQIFLVTVAHPPIWRCYPGGNFESHLLLSLMYVILLLASTAVVALFCSSSFKKQQRMEGESYLCHETRWILLASLLVGTVFTFWGIATAVILPPTQADLATALAHLLAAMALLLCLYLPKMCMHRRLQSSQVSVQSTLPTIYDISHFQPPTIKGLQAFMPPPSVMDVPSLEDDDDEMHSDPTQIIPSSLYSLDMFSQSSRSQDDDEEDGDHCEPGTNEFTAPLNPALHLDRDTYPLQEGMSYM
uniref:G-protein coupled receptors family 3 profile domain-containing protein n=1 Tax=Timema douglasi TaxID=61478 RepID=A0A7R8Z931_TIMDO|nr:unnamed protein product [Timema douglasi]